MEQQTPLVTVRFTVDRTLDTRREIRRIKAQIRELLTCGQDRGETLSARFLYVALSAKERELRRLRIQCRNA